jgi:hypothetical protein
MLAVDGEDWVGVLAEASLGGDLACNAFVGRSFVISPISSSGTREFFETLACTRLESKACSNNWDEPAVVVYVHLSVELNEFNSYTLLHNYKQTGILISKDTDLLGIFLMDRVPGNTERAWRLHDHIP